jgi:DNA-binding XRE family transcriptional regulator
MEIGNKLKSLRAEKGLSPVQVSERLGISETTYRRYESDKSQPDIGTIDKIAKFYGKNLSEVLPPEMLLTACPIGKNCHEAVGQNAILSEKLIEQYEKRISLLEEKIGFLEKLLNTKPPF